MSLEKLASVLVVVQALVMVKRPGVVTRVSLAVLALLDVSDFRADRCLCSVELLSVALVTIFFAADVAVINVGELNDAFDAGSEITPEMLVEKGLVRSSFEELKVLGDGELSKNLKISAHRFSASAEAKISAAGGTYSLIAVGSF